MNLRGIFSAIRTARTDPQRASLFGWFRPTVSAVNVTHEAAFRAAAVWACIDVVSSAIASSNWCPYRVVRGEKKETPGDALSYVLNTRPNPEMTAKAAKQCLMIAALAYGNGYAEIERDAGGNVVGLWPLFPDRVTLRRNPDTNLLYYQVLGEPNGSNEIITLYPQNVFHIRGPGLAGVAGDDMIGKAAESIGLSIAMSQFAASYFGNGAQLGGVLTYEKKLDDSAYDRLREQLAERHKGARNAFKWAIFDSNVKYQPIDSNAEDAQMVEARNQAIEEICRWFRVPPHKIGHLLRATNNNIEHQGLEFGRDTLRPWATEIQQEAQYKFYGAAQRDRTIVVDTTWASQGDFKSRMEAYQIGRAMGVFSANDILRDLDRNTIGPDGDLRIVNGAAIPLEDVGKNLTPPAAGGTPAQPAQPNTGNPPPIAPADIARNWAASVLVKCVRRRDHLRNLFELRGDPTPTEKAARVATDYAASQFEPFVPVLQQLAGREVSDDLATAWEAVNEGMMPADAARRLIEGIRAC